MGFLSAHHFTICLSCALVEEQRRSCRGVVRLQVNLGFNPAVVSAMKTRRQNVSEDRLTISRRNTRAKSSLNGGENSLPIPIDLIIEILSRLPAKSIARCRCVSKLWASVLGRPDFTELFFTRSSARPQVLFMCKKGGEVLFFSSPQAQNPDDNLSPVVANYHMKLAFDVHYSHIFGLVHGLVCFIDERVLKGRTKMVQVICNPSTGRYLTLPKMKTKRRVGVHNYFGYDPIDKQFKVLSMTLLPYGENSVFEEHQILTLGTGNLSWRMIECSIPHESCYVNKGICINGVLYYPAIHWSLKTDIIVCFDIRSEKFSFLKAREAGCGTMVNYNGKLGLLVSQALGSGRLVDGKHTSFKLWILEDAGNQEWSEHTYVLPALWKELVGNTVLCFVGVTRTNEIVLSTYHQSAPFYIFYYNIERNTVIRVGIQGMEACKHNEVYTFLNHVENVKLFHVQ